MNEKKKMGKGAKLILSLLLPVLTVSLIRLLISYLIEREVAPLYAVRYYSGMLEYIFASLAIIVGGAMLADIAEYDAKKE